MPTKRFDVIAQDKRKMISEVIMNEFLDSPAGEVSMSQVASKAKISRTSLYGYFEDKEDIQQFALRVVVESLMEYNKNQLLENYGDLWIAMERTMQHYVSKCKKAPFLALQLFQERQKDRVLFQDPGYQEYKDWLYEHVDKRRFRNPQRDKVNTLIEICQLLLIGSTLKAACSQQSETDTIVEFKRQMELLKGQFEKD